MKYPWLLSGILLIFVCLITGCERNAEITPTLSGTESGTETALPAPIPAPIHIHVWREATCQAPRTCGECDATEGVALPHTWKNSTCHEPMTCTMCDETEGEPLPHEFSQANFQEPMICTVCGDIEGEPVPPNFLTGGRVLSALGVTHSYAGSSSCGRDTPVPGTVILSNSHIIEGDEEREPKEGFEWLVFHVDYIFEFTSLSMAQNGIRFSWFFLDYYNGIEADMVPVTDEPYLFINYKGEIIPVDAFISTRLHGEWVPRGSGFTYNHTDKISVRIPIDYDGIMFTLAKPVYYGSFGEYTVGEMIEENTLFFKLR